MNENGDLKTGAAVLKWANALMALAIIGMVCAFLAASLNCSAPTQPVNAGPKFLKEDSLALVEIFRLNKLTWMEGASRTSHNSSGRVTALDLSADSIDTIPPALGQLVELTDLDLSMNNIRSMPQQVEMLTNLETLNLQRNALTELPDGFRNVHLTSIDLSHNRLTVLPVNIDVTHLKILRLDSNLITALPPDFKYLGALVEFSISQNRLDSLPKEINDILTLRRLDVSKNRLKSLPATLTDLGLDYLNVGDNQLCFFNQTQPDSATTKLEEWLDTYDRDWKATQTCP